MSENLRDYSKQELENTIDEDGKFLNINEQFKKALENRKITEEEYNFLTKRLKEEKDSLTNETKTKLSKFLGDIKTQVESTGSAITKITYEQLFDEDKKTYGQTISEELYNDEKKEQLLKENKLQEIKKDYNKIKNHKNEFISGSLDISKLNSESVQNFITENFKENKNIIILLNNWKLDSKIGKYLLEINGKKNNNIFDQLSDIYISVKLQNISEKVKVSGNEVLIIKQEKLQDPKMLSLEERLLLNTLHGKKLLSVTDNINTLRTFHFDKVIGENSEKKVHDFFKNYELSSKQAQNQLENRKKLYEKEIIKAQEKDNYELKNPGIKTESDLYNKTNVEWVEIQYEHDINKIIEKTIIDLNKKYIRTLFSIRPIPKEVFSCLGKEKIPSPVSFGGKPLMLNFKGLKNIDPESVEIALPSIVGEGFINQIISGLGDAKDTIKKDPAKFIIDTCAVLIAGLATGTVVVFSGGYAAIGAGAIFTSVNKLYKGIGTGLNSLSKGEGFINGVGKGYGILDEQGKIKEATTVSMEIGFEMINNIMLMGPIGKVGQATEKFLVGSKEAVGLGKEIIGKSLAFGTEAAFFTGLNTITGGIQEGFLTGSFDKAIENLKEMSKAENLANSFANNAIFIAALKSSNSVGVKFMKKSISENLLNSSLKLNDSLKVELQKLGKLGVEIQFNKGKNVNEFIFKKEGKVLESIDPLLQNFQKLNVAIINTQIQILQYQKIIFEKENSNEFKYMKLLKKYSLDFVDSNLSVEKIINKRIQKIDKKIKETKNPEEKTKLQEAKEELSKLKTDLLVLENKIQNQKNIEIDKNNEYTQNKLSELYYSQFSETIPDVLKSKNPVAWIDKQGSIHYNKKVIEQKYNLKITEIDNNIFFDGVRFDKHSKVKDVLKYLKVLKSHEVTHRVLEAYGIKDEVEIKGIDGKSKKFTQEQISQILDGSFKIDKTEIMALEKALQEKIGPNFKITKPDGTLDSDFIRRFDTKDLTIGKENYSRKTEVAKEGFVEYELQELSINKNFEGIGQIDEIYFKTSKTSLQSIENSISFEKLETGNIIGLKSGDSYFKLEVKDKINNILKVEISQISEGLLKKSEIIIKIKEMDVNNNYQKEQYLLDKEIISKENKQILDEHQYLKKHTEFLGPLSWRRLLGVGSRGTVIEYGGKVVKIANQPFDPIIVNNLAKEYLTHEKIQHQLGEGASKDGVTIPKWFKIPGITHSPSIKEPYYIFDKIEGQSFKTICLLGKYSNILKNIPENKLKSFTDYQVERLLIGKEVEGYKIEKPINDYEIMMIGAGKGIESIMKSIEKYAPEPIKSELKSKKDEIGRCMDYLASKGLKHPDFHSGNIMLGKNGEVYVIDFGQMNTSG